MSWNRDQARRDEQAAANYESYAESSKRWKNIFFYGSVLSLLTSWYVATEPLHEEFNPLNLPDIEDFGLSHFYEFSLPILGAVVFLLVADAHARNESMYSSNAETNSRWAARHDQWADEAGEPK